MNTQDILKELAELGSDQTKKVLLRHGAREPFYGVKVQDLKKVISKLKKDIKKYPDEYPGGLHQLAIDLYQTGNSDAMYMAGLMVDAQKMSMKEIQDWAEKAYWYMISDYTVAGTAAESRFGWELASKWIESDQEFICSAGWATFSAILSITPDDELDLEALTRLIERVKSTLHNSQNRVRYAMNGFLIAAGSFTPNLTGKAKAAGLKIGKVEVDMGGTSCKVPGVVEYIEKVEKKGYVGKKRARAFC